ncbi:tautomerase family protein [Kineosporia succinea]|uniref:Phenylpyruvate tautomerase PptA (4-oxalocrotonate tautomerase family) n=1 Tax=Kineosporia succinea TaxID=84632 RepID=A0ABT9P801_9ACTN|nr:tautomerase family protein [Kineosporia succinea]MDP9828803.1 phenylpyruvate tautomerase PptA (4-oxalocrotonate tautomerase family) [Kineosporia succinea]
MPHLTARVLEPQLAGREPELIAALTDAVVKVYGDWARPLAVVHLEGVPPGRWGVGGVPVPTAAPAVTFGIREGALTGPEGAEHASALVASITDAVVAVFGPDVRPGVSVELVATPPGRSGSGGVIDY